VTHPEDFSGSRCLVVGGAGFVGSNLVRHLLASKANRVDVIDNLLSAEKENLPTDSRVELFIGSIADDSVLARIEDVYDYVFHLATFHGNQSSIADPLRDHENNTLTTLKLFERLKNFRTVRKVVYVGAGCAVAKKGTEDAVATQEDAPISLDMDSPYSISKIIGEFYSVYYNRHEKLPVVRARFQNVYGPGEVLGAGLWRGTPATIWRNVTPTFIYKSLQGESLPLQNEGRSTRDFIYVDDICRGLIACALRAEGGSVYNLASGVETSIRTLAETINRFTENSAAVQLLPRRPWDTSLARFGSTEKAKGEIQFEATVTLDEGLEKTIAWTKRNLERIQTCMDKHQHRLNQD
jgi:nucleoside-diphosphate-sugar epimerase